MNSARRRERKLRSKGRRRPSPADESAAELLLIYPPGIARKALSHKGFMVVRYMQNTAKTTRNMNRNRALAPSDLAAVLDYDPETGRLKWKERPVRFFKSSHDCRVWNTKYSGKEAFTFQMPFETASALLSAVQYPNHVANQSNYGPSPKKAVVSQ